MADLVASPVVNLVLKKLVSGLWKELGLIKNVKKDLEKLQELLSTISDVLEDAERRSISDKSLHNWLRSLRNAALDADDVIDEFQWEALRQRAKGRNRTGVKVRDFFSSHNPLVFSSKMAHKMKDLRNRFDDIAKLRKDFHLSEGSSSEGVNSADTHSFVIESEVFGREKDKEKVIDFLVKNTDDNGQNLSIPPIVGLGGMGKTTLAGLVFNDEDVKKEFDLQAWICVGEISDVKAIVRKIIVGVTKQNCELPDMENLQQVLQGNLMEKKFMLVLDDLWNEDHQTWEQLKHLLKVGKQGSKIIVTTRSETVARKMGTVDAHKLEGLSDDDCWILFEQRAFGQGKAERTPRLVEIGREIARKCGGLPLAAKALGSLMSDKRGEDQWLDIQHSALWELPKEDDQILPSLMLTYSHLPSPLKQCFAYCSVFPKDYRIEKKHLIRLWIAEGFIQSTDDDKAEQRGSQYFNMLLWRSFFQETEKDKGSDDIISCKMHDLVHDLACSIAMEDFSIIQMGEERSIAADRCRYLSIIISSGSRSLEIPDSVNASEKLRSLILLEDFYGVCPIDLNWNLLPVTLRVLDLTRSYNFDNRELEEIPDAISRLKHLRYLNLSGSGIEELPDSITSLYNLETLVLARCFKLIKLPRGMGKLVNLRHLDIPSGLEGMPRGMGKLRRLQELPFFIVGRGSGSAKIAELKNLNQLSGALRIRGLYNVKDGGEAKEANLRAKTKLQRLELRGCEDEDALENLQPPSGLKELKIWDYRGMRCPSWMRQTDLTALQRLKIFDCPRLRIQPCQLPPSIVELAIRESNEELLSSTDTGAGGGGCLKGLSSLKKLLISSCKASSSTCAWDGLQYLTALKELVIEFCDDLSEGLPDGMVQQNMPSLRTLGLYFDGNLKSLIREAQQQQPPPFFTHLHRLTIMGCNALTALPEWVGGLTSLQSLEITDCNNIPMLPDGLRQLTRLQKLEISWCPVLQRRCEREKGEDWHKIAHIPNIILSGPSNP